MIRQAENPQQENPQHMMAGRQEIQPVSIGTLMTASLVACLLAAATLVLFILPAEFDIDPTGLGEKLGLAALADARSDTPRDAPSIAPAAAGKDTSPGLTADKAAASDPAAAEAVTGRVSDRSTNDRIEVVVPAESGVEYKFRMDQFAKMTYQWSTDGDALEFDLHGEPAGDTTGYFESYVLAVASKVEGSFTTPFDGSHGWYWKNTSDEDATVTLQVRGVYEIIGLK